MSIKNKQILRETNRIMSDFYTRGIMANLSDVQREVKAKFARREAGLPRFQFAPVKPGDTSDPVRFNNALRDVHEDFLTAYAEVGDSVDRMMAVANQYDTEKNSVELQLHRLDSRMNALLDALETHPRRNVYAESFQTFDQTDFQGDEARGIPRTDAWVDLRHRQLKLDSVPAFSRKHDLSVATSVVTTLNNQAGREVLPLANALKDTINEAWEYIVESPSAAGASVSVLLTLPAPVEANVLSLLLHSPKDTFVTCETSADGTVYRAASLYTSGTALEWSVAEAVQYIRLTLRKDEPDFTNGNIHEYHFGALNISARKEAYLAEGRYVSAPHAFPEAVDTVTLEADAMVYPGTSVRYYLGPEDDANMTEWQEMQPGQPLALKQMAHGYLPVNSTAAGYGQAVTGPEFDRYGTKHHQLAVLSDVPLPGHSDVYLGESMWLASIRTGVYPADYVPSLKDWTQVKGVRTQLVNFQQAPLSGVPLEAGALYRFTTHVYYEEDYDIANVEMIAGANSPQVYVNNTLLKPQTSGQGSDRRLFYSYRFTKGWNQIDMLVNAFSQDGLQPNLAFFLSTAMYARKEPLQEVSTYDLIHNVTKKEWHCYAIDQGRLLVNYDPKAMDMLGEGVSYFMEYSHLPQSPATTRYRVMVALQRTAAAATLTPVINGYKLIVE